MPDRLIGLHSDASLFRCLDGCGLPGRIWPRHDALRVAPPIGRCAGLSNGFFSFACHMDCLSDLTVLCLLAPEVGCGVWA
jgi:hypothetical protein